MEMKNVFSGLGAKLALALLVVGTMTSCYEKEELNVEKTDDPIDPVYYIQGNVCDVETGKPLEAKVTLSIRHLQMVLIQLKLIVITFSQPLRLYSSLQVIKIQYLLQQWISLWFH